MNHPTKQIVHTLFFLCFTAVVTHAQYYPWLQRSKQKSIFVSGSAEMEVPPDQIQLEVVLQEHGHKLSNKDMEKLEQKFFDALSASNISKDQVQFGSSNATWYNWYYKWYYRKNPYVKKSYILNLGIETDFLSLINSLDFDGVSSLKIVSTNNKDIQKFRKEVKVMAIKAAKEKAQYLLESVDAKVGPIISITEVPEENTRYQNANIHSNYRMSRSENFGDDEVMKNVNAIKLRYVVNAYFEILE